MTAIQIHNIFIYLGILIVDGEITSKSPDYIEEKSLRFFDRLGKNEFIKKPNNWNKYCKNWKVDENDFELMNIMNFLYEVRIKNVFEKFEKYIGDFEIINKNDLSYLGHFKLVEFINKSVDFNSRFFKLKILCHNQK